MSLYFDTVGRGEDVVWLHGWAMNGTVWRQTAAALADDFCHQLVDLPGHGRSAPLAGLTLEGMVDALEATFPNPVHVVGWSLGGAVATSWALRRPDQVRSLTLVASSPCFAQRDDWQPAMPMRTLQQFAASLGDDWQGTLRRFINLQTLGSPSAREQSKTLLAELLLHGEPDQAALREGLDILRDTDLRTRIAELDVPLLLQFGDKDTLSPLGAGDWLAQQRPDAQYVVHKGAAHVPFLSHADDFIAAQRAFLSAI
ncbi:pimeloyl-[acyl-carrier protein] methyl ester esterase [Andreprevotia lacus DSM 23236]|jgi:pimeloyl-[acyl-carrier protein] methyl ester esterase|uniref:Pimeloyl-[acyl-carrier protein] methyl ester esterase n=1 Tax=Andreprevotia lacus DSM 23236 TaxID=1121001 RepID=A0A1W1Y0U7_9NEIS|nr:pimeloyl-ACP methyl ester esterase BioH [Andreprevotia lacus]SMC29776.1 pimeloyl-[acyl-carrier protein] methyl ester esterase [Andreprevotia lacus DSM 23236]